MIVNFTIKNDGVFITKMHRLFAAGNIKNRKAKMKKVYIFILIAAVFIWPAMAHVPDYLLIRKVGINRTRNTAHYFP
jgi:hypothetical protein